MAQPYATRADLTLYGLPAAALGDVSSEVVDAVIASCCELADSYLRAKFALPLTSFGVSLTLNVCKLAAFEVMRIRGFAPEGLDKSIRDGYEDAVAWFEGIAEGRVTPVVVDAKGSNLTGGYGGAFVQQPTYVDGGQVDAEGRQAATPQAPTGRGW